MHKRSSLAWTAMAALATGLSAAPAFAADDGPSCATPTEVQGFRTCADVAKAEQEGSLVVYSTDVEAGTVQILADFHKLFPKINATYVRASPSSLYARVLAERQANNLQADVLMLSDIGLGIDFQKKEGYQLYRSPELDGYKPDYQSSPAGYFTWGSLIMAGIAYNPTVVPPDQAPKTWKDTADPKWTGAINFKSFTSGLQQLVWYELRELYGDQFWLSFKPLKPRALDSQVQQYERLINGKDKINAAAQYSGYLDYKKKGAPLNFVVPEDGMPAGPQIWGLVKGNQHPEAGTLFLDWFLSKEGQTSMVHALTIHSVRSDVQAPDGSMPIADMKLLYPKDWNDFLASKTTFNREWKDITQN